MKTIKFRFIPDTFTNLVRPDWPAMATPERLMDETENLVRAFMAGEENAWLDAAGITFGLLCFEPVIFRLGRLIREGVIPPDRVQFDCGGCPVAFDADGDFQLPPDYRGLMDWRAKELFN